MGGSVGDQSVVFRVSNDEVGRPSRIGVHSSGNSCDHVGSRRFSSSRNSSSRGSAASTTSCSTTTDHGCRSISASAASTHPSVAPVAGQHVPQHARVSPGAQAQSSERAHQPIVDHPTSAVGAEQRAFSARCFDGVARSGELVEDHVFAGYAELHAVAPRVPAEAMTSADCLTAELGTLGRGQLVTDRKEGRRHLVRSQHVEHCLGDARRRAVVEREGDDRRRHSGCSTSPPGWRANRTGSACTGPSTSHGQPPKPVRW